MPRSESEIQADIDAMKAKGVHPASKPLRELRDELKALQAPPAPASSPPDAPRVTTTSDVASAVVAPPVMAEAGEWAKGVDWKSVAPARKSRWCSEEEFIDRTLTKIAAGLDFGTGSMSNVVKKLYERLDAALKIRRILVGVMEKLAPGESLPPFSKLGRNPNTGEQTFEVSATPFAGKETPKAPPPAVAPVTEGGMPVRSAKPSVAAILETVTGGDPRRMVEQEIMTRPDPIRTHAPASA